MKKTEHELRCTCHRKPMLGIFGIENGRPYIHIKVYKNKKIYAEVVVTHGGLVKLFCRDCLRWNRILIRDGGPYLDKTPPPL